MLVTRASGNTICLSPARLSGTTCKSPVSPLPIHERFLITANTQQPRLHTSHIRAQPKSPHKVNTWNLEIQFAQLKFSYSTWSNCTQSPIMSTTPPLTSPEVGISHKKELGDTKQMWGFGDFCHAESRDRKESTKRGKRHRQISSSQWWHI